MDCGAAGLMWRDAGLLRDGVGLRRAKRGLAGVGGDDAARVDAAGGGGAESACRWRR